MWDYLQPSLNNEYTQSDGKKGESKSKRSYGLHSIDPVVREGPVLGGFTCANNPNIDIQTQLFYYLKHVRRLPLSVPIRSQRRTHTFILLLMSGIESNPGPRTPRYPCGVCTRAVRDIGQRALACDECDKWCHMSCLSMNTPEFDLYANSDLPWYCPSCNSLNRSTVVYDLPFADVDDKSLFTESDHSSQNPSDMISSSLSNVCSEYSSPRPTSSDQSARKKGKDIATLMETVCPNVILGTETWLSPDVCSSEVFDDSLGYDIHRKDRSENPHGGVLIAAKKDLELHDVKCSKDVELISSTINVSKQKKMVISSFYRPPLKS